MYDTPTSDSLREPGAAGGGAPSADPKDAIRAPYTPPTLTVYGTLDQLTATVGHRGRRDGRRSRRRTGF